MRQCWGNIVLLTILFWGCNSGPSAPANAGKLGVTTTQQEREEMRSALQAMTGTIALQDGRTVQPNLFFDFEEEEELGGIRAKTKAFTGKWSYHIPAGKKFGPSVVRQVDQVSDGLTAVQVSCRVWSTAADPQVTIKIKVGTGLFGEPIITKQLQEREHKVGTWEQFNAELLIRDHEVAGDDEITISLINRAKQEVFVDDMAISYLSKNVLMPAPNEHSQQ